MAGLVILLATGCSQTTLTHPNRSATEQLLISAAADRAIAGMSFAELKGKRIYVDASNLEGYDSRYVLSSIREAVSRAGGLLQQEPARSEVIVEARSGALSIDPSESLIGIPKTGVPLPLAGALETPEVALYKTSRYHSIAKISGLAYSTEPRGYLMSTGPSVGRAFARNYKVLGLIQWTVTDLPDRSDPPKCHSKPRR